MRKSVEGVRTEVVRESGRIRDKSLLEKVTMRSLAALVITTSWSGGCGGMLSSRACP